MPSTRNRGIEPSSVAANERVGVLQERLAEHGLRVTPQRLHVLQALLQGGSHPTAEQVWEHVRQVSPTTSLATIYKTLDTLSDIGEVLKIDTRDDRYHYDAARPEAHPHAVCRRCGRIDDVEITGAEGMLSQAMKVSGYQLSEQQVTFFGLCRECQG